MNDDKIIEAYQKLVSYNKTKSNFILMDIVSILYEEYRTNFLIEKKNIVFKSSLINHILYSIKLNYETIKNYLGISKTFSFVTGYKLMFNDAIKKDDSLEYLIFYGLFNYNFLNANKKECLELLLDEIKNKMLEKLNIKINYPITYFKTYSN